MIERVLTNLLDNAIRHTPEGGEIEVALRADGRGGRGASQRQRAGHPGAQLQPEPVHAAFVPYGGTGRSGGLGLVIVQRILQLHGSDIRLQQRAEKGAVFCFALR